MNPSLLHVGKCDGLWETREKIVEKVVQDEPELHARVWELITEPFACEPESQASLGCQNESRYKLADEVIDFDFHSYLRHDSTNKCWRLV